MTEKKPPSDDTSLQLPPTITVGDLAENLDVSPVEIIKQLMRAGIMAGINQSIAYEVAYGLAKAYGFDPEEKPAEEKK